MSIDKEQREVKYRSEMEKLQRAYAQAEADRDVWKQEELAREMNELESRYMGLL